MLVLFLKGKTRSISLVSDYDIFPHDEADALILAEGYLSMKIDASNFKVSHI